MTKRLKLNVLMAIAVWIVAQGAYGASTPNPWDQPAASLAQQISDILGPGQARLVIENKSSIATTEIPKIRKLLEQDLKTHGVLVSGADSASAVRVTLSESTRERLWVAEVIEGDRTQATMVDLGPVTETPVQASGGLTLRAQTILTVHAPVLAALEIPDGLIALEPEQIELFTHTAIGWQSEKQVPVQQKGALTRDPRGALLGYANGSSFEAWLPGVECSGSPGAQPSGWNIECHQNDDPWAITQPPLDLTDFGSSNLGENIKVTPIRAFYNSARNYFTGVLAQTTGPELPPFYSAALVPRPAGGAALLIGGTDGRLQMVENGALWPVAGTRDWGSDFAVLHSGCGAGTQVIASGSGEAAHDSLRAYELPALEAIPASSPLAVDGTVTALWSAPDSRSVFAVVRSAENEYEVDRVTALCN
ncbi:MAG: hypothetical protein WBA18_15365 [Terracidiphilus sp.]